MRMTEGFQEYVEKLGARLGFESPIVGIQVRRTDKLRLESRFIGIEEYMEIVHDFFNDLEVRGTNVTTRRIYLATDDLNVIQEAKKKFPNYKFVFNEDSVASASLGRRGSVDNMKYLMADILFLSRSDFLVCGMSSNICRLAYELMQTLHSDATRKLVSLDLPFCIHSQSAHEVEARFPHTPRSGREIALQKGDRVVRSVYYYSKHRNSLDGFWHGTNRRTRKTGFYPIYKTVEVQSLADTPSFDWIDRSEDYLVTKSSRWWRRRRPSMSHRWWRRRRPSMSHRWWRHCRPSTSHRWWKRRRPSTSHRWWKRRRPWSRPRATDGGGAGDRP
ncbi:hypothetical protein C7M84_018389 [Penaeus vannamei]|uniref:GT23 domain-containing protein n=1 Tax=Penaeus vannamei TaxID=6689 RepID=A0A423SHS9_PENVA|nr:hypothetical protein C7M84_018389 [Penaeus vannamei]